MRDDYEGTYQMCVSARCSFGVVAAREDLGFASARILRKHQLDGVCGFHPALLLQFVNPIGHRLNHFARGLCGSVSLRRGFLLTNPLVLLDDFNSFLFWHLNQLYLLPKYGCLFRLNDLSRLEFPHSYRPL